jgi:K+-sensing histidine kinase KdpD
MGIAADLLPHIFDLFVQGERRLDRAQGGLGIGLTLVQRLVELHDAPSGPQCRPRARGNRRLAAIPAPVSDGRRRDQHDHHAAPGPGHRRQRGLAGHAPPAP